MKLSREAVLPYRPEFLFDIAADIESYPDFLPACERLAILGEEEDGALVAQMEIAYKNLVHEKWTSRVCINREHLEIEAVRADENTTGLFSRMRCHWHFAPHRQGGQAVMKIDYEMLNPLAGFALQPLISYAVDKIAASFVARAHALAREERQKG